METFWGLSQTAWTGVTALLTAGLLVVAVIAALYAARQVRIAREQADEARKATLEASRPYVVVTTEPSKASRNLFDLVVRNIGQRPAIAVAIALDPPPVRARESVGHEISNIKMLKEPVAMLAPGQEMHTFYDSHIDRNGRADLPTNHKVSLRYEDSSGLKYEEASVVDLEATKGTMYTDVKTIHDVGKSLVEIRDVLKRASVLARRGSLEVEASVESRSQQRDRRAREAAEARQLHDQMVARVQPTKAASVLLDGAEHLDPKTQPLWNLAKRAVAWVRRRT